MFTPQNCLQVLADPTIFEINRLPPSCDATRFASQYEATTAKRSSYKQYLDGTWRFKWARNYANAPQEFFKSDFDDSDFDTITVPGHFETQGFGHANYTNIAYPWDGHEAIRPGQIPTEYNPVGSYVCNFTVPAHFANTFICFNGVDSAFALWLNGHFVGYSEDSCTPAHFDLSPYLIAGNNRLCVQVFKYCAGSFLEDQDFFRFSGIFRSVYLYTKPVFHIEDLEYSTTLNPAQHSATLNLKLKIHNYGSSSAPCVVKVESPKLGIADSLEVTGERDLSLTYEIQDCDQTKLWSAEFPNLFNLGIELSVDGTSVEYVEQAIGIRQFSMNNGVMCLNQRRIIFNGVNRHETYPDTGRALADCEADGGRDLARIEADLLLLKEMNVNAIRTSHYPNCSDFYGLCDRLGFYVIDETNIESHGAWSSPKGPTKDDTYVVPASKPEWEKAVLARGEAMLERDKNHPCVLIWSCGNEAWGGSVLYKLSEYFRKRDPLRLVHYEGVFNDREYNDTSDMESQMYPSVAKIKEFLAAHRDKPFICCEYTHAMGNSNGRMDLYTDLSHCDPLYQGGFIWDFVDQALYIKHEDGSVTYGYGGDFGDRPNDLNFCANGLVLPDRTLTAKMLEAKHNYSPVQVKAFDSYLELTNYNLFKDGSSYSLRFQILVNGTKRYESKLHSLNGLLKTKAWQEQVDVQELPSAERFELPSDALSFAKQQVQEGAGEVSYVAELLESGRIVVAAQFVYNSYSANSAGACLAWHNLHLAKVGSLRVDDCDYNLGVHGSDFSYMFSKSSGLLNSIKSHGQELLKRNMRLNFFRATTDNDRGNGQGQRLGAWMVAGMFTKCIKCVVNKLNDGGVEIVFTHLLGGCKHSFVTLSYHIAVDGTLKITMDYKASSELPMQMVDFGFLLPLYREFDQLHFYGKGPFDSYCDRNRATILGAFSSTVAKQHTPYMIPQENGNHDQCRYVALTNQAKRGIVVEMVDHSFNFSALPWTPEELESALHQEELPPVCKSVLRISGAMMGLAGDDSWGAQPLVQHRLANQDRKFSVSLRVI